MGEKQASVGVSILTDFTFTICVPVSILVYCSKRSKDSTFLMAYVYGQFCLALYCSWVRLRQSDAPLLTKKHVTQTKEESYEDTDNVRYLSVLASYVAEVYLMARQN